jgi:hypothetical protein
MKKDYRELFITAEIRIMLAEKVRQVCHKSFIHKPAAI